MALAVIGKVILDTNVFVDYLRTGAHAQWIWASRRRLVRFLSAVVLMELRLGADTPRRMRAVDRILAAFPAHRLITPTPAQYDRAGRLFRRLHGDGSGVQDRLAPMNDILIALTAWSMGATVVTANHLEFQRIARHLPGLALTRPES